MKTTDHVQYVLDASDEYEDEELLPEGSVVLVVGMAVDAFPAKDRELNGTLIPVVLSSVGKVCITNVKKLRGQWRVMLLPL